MLSALGEDAIALREEFPQDIKDKDLLKELQGANIVFVSADRKIRTKAVEATLLKEANVTSLFLGPFWSKMGLWEQAAWLVKQWPKIRGFVDGVAKHRADNYCRKSYSCC